MAAAAEVETKVEGGKGVQQFLKARLTLVQSQLEGLGDKVRGRVGGGLKKLEPMALERVKTVLGAERFDKVMALIAKAPVAPEGVQKRIVELKKKVDGLAKGLAPASQKAEDKAV